MIQTDIEWMCWHQIYFLSPHLVNNKTGSELIREQLGAKLSWEKECFPHLRRGTYPRMSSTGTGCRGWVCKFELGELNIFLIGKTKKIIIIQRRQEKPLSSPLWSKLLKNQMKKSLNPLMGVLESGFWLDWPLEFLSALGWG